MNKTTAAIAAVMLLIVAPVRAQTGLFMGAHVTGAKLNHVNLQDAVALDFGSGFGVHAGLSFGGSFGMLVNYDRTTKGARTGDLDLGQWEVLGRMSVLEVGPAKAYLTAGFSRRKPTSSFNDDGSEDFPFAGMHPTAGLTGQLPVTSKLALDAGLLWTFGKFTDNQGQSASRIDRVTLGASYYLFGGK